MIDEIEDWWAVLDRMSAVIKETEDQMRLKGLTLPVEFEGLSWRICGKQMRICFLQKPLIEHSVEVRAENFEKLPKLVSAANQEMQKKFGHLLDSQIGV